MLIYDRNTTPLISDILLRILYEVRTNSLTYGPGGVFVPCGFLVLREAQI